MFLLFLAKKSYPVLILMAEKKHSPFTECISGESFLAVLVKLMAKLNSYILNQFLSFIPGVVTAAFKCSESGSLVLDEHRVVWLTGASRLSLSLVFVFGFFSFLQQVNRRLPPPIPLRADI